MMRPALFLDRDGIINEDRGYVFEQSRFVWCPGIFSLARTAHMVGMPIVVVTNQSGIARGYYSEAQFFALTAWMCSQFAAEGAPIAAVYHCPYHPEGVVPRYRLTHSWRKPAPGMILAARDNLNLDLPKSYLFGDQWSDIAAARAAGVGTALLIGQNQRSADPINLNADGIFSNLVLAAQWFSGDTSRLYSK